MLLLIILTCIFGYFYFFVSKELFFNVMSIQLQVYTLQNWMDKQTQYEQETVQYAIQWKNVK